jgi:hypothetical protein
MSAEYYVARWHSDEGCHVVIARRGRTRLYVCLQAYPVTVKALPLTAARYVKVLDYPLRTAARRFLQFAKHGNATKAALQHSRQPPRPDESVSTN